jgi:hypothetical protein
VIRLFAGYDRREAVGFHVFLSSVLDRASVPVCLHALDAKGLPEGTNGFTFSRFLVPWLCGFKGRAIFADACDMLMLSDIAALDALFDPSKAVQVVRQDYKTRHPIKYRGTEMECPNRDYDRKNWASLMIVNCEHPAWQGMTPERVREFAAVPTQLLGLRWIADEAIGFLPDAWNRLIDEGQDTEGAALLHWTAGIPAFKHYADAPGADAWRRQKRELEWAGG